MLHRFNQPKKFTLKKINFELLTIETNLFHQKLKRTILFDQKKTDKIKQTINSKRQKLRCMFIKLLHSKIFNSCFFFHDETKRVG